MDKQFGNHVQRDYLILSDLHLGDGKQLEDFKQSTSFSRLIETNMYTSSIAGRRLEIVLNGDIIDFLQISPLGDHTRTGAMSKLQVCIDHHYEFFQTLMRLIQQGHYVTFVRGNHDFDLILPDVFMLLHQRLSATATPSEQIRLVPELRTSGIHIEHGHQYDPPNWIDYRYPAQVDGNQEAQLHLPRGSQFVIDFVNKVEERYPFIDKIKGIQSALLLGLVIDFKRTIGIIPVVLGLSASYDALHVALEYARPKKSTGKSVAKGNNDELEWNYLVDCLRNVREEILQLSLVADADSLQDFATGKALPSAALPLKLKIYQYALKLLQPNRIEQADMLEEGANQVSLLSGAEYVIMGHTHAAKHYKLASGATYINTGTWVPRPILPDIRSTDELRTWLMDLVSGKDGCTYETDLTYVHISHNDSSVDVQLKSHKD